jgi:hypothetical protein
VLTGIGSNAVEVAHIYPFCLLSKEEDTFGKRHVFWQILSNFWPEEKITAWEAIIFPDGSEERGLETPRNLITFGAHVHKLWNKGDFALKPISISEDNTTLTIQFFWQTKQPLIMPTINLTTVPLSTRDLHETDNKSYLHNRRSSEDGSSQYHLIKSGDLFELKTDDPEARPLPSIALLEMQWFLQRVMGMAGAADELEDREYHFSDDGFCRGLYYRDDVSDLGEPDEDEDDVSNLGLDEAGDESFLSSAGLSDPIIPAITNLLPSIDAPKHYAEEMEETEERFREKAAM